MNILKYTCEDCGIYFIMKYIKIYIGIMKIYIEVTRCIETFQEYSKEIYFTFKNWRDNNNKKLCYRFSHISTAFFNPENARNRVER